MEPTPDPVAVCARLLECARGVSNALGAGDLEACISLMAERESLLRRLSLMDPASFPPAVREEVVRLLGAVRELDRDHAVLVGLVREELAAALKRLERGRAGTASYLRAAEPAGDDPGRTC